MWLLYMLSILNSPKPSNLRVYVVCLSMHSGFILDLTHYLMKDCIGQNFEYCLIFVVATSKCLSRQELLTLVESMAAKAVKSAKTLKVAKNFKPQDL